MRKCDKRLPQSSALGSYTWRVESNNCEFTADFAHAWTIRDGRAIAFHEYTDTPPAPTPIKKP